jgi:prevent-host-death family protein
MKPVSISVAKNTLSALIKKVRRGESITITDRGVPVARIVPPAPTAGIPAWAIELAQRGVLKLPELEPTSAWYEDLPRPRGQPSNAIVDALIEERRSGR